VATQKKFTEQAGSATHQANGTCQADINTHRVEEIASECWPVIIENEGTVAEELYCSIVLLAPSQIHVECRQFTEPWRLKYLNVQTLGLSFELLPLL
jgi:hypothetical protein